MLDDVLEQEEGVRILRRVLNRQFVSPLLLLGNDGVGRRFAVQQLARELFCEGTHEKNCGCSQCLQLKEGVHPDLVVVSAQGDKEIGVDQVREALAGVDAFPSIAPLRLFLVDGADRMSIAAANALLKTLEEPNAVTRFFLLAEQNSRVIPTIQSRCGRVDFRPLSESVILSKISLLETDPIKALVFTRMGEGSIGRADRYWRSGKLTLRDKVFSLLSAGAQRDIPSIFLAVSSLDKDNKDLPLALRFLEHLIHDALMVQYDPARIINLDLADDLKKLSVKMGPKVLIKLMNGVRKVSTLSRSVRINLPFHVQTAFVEACITQG